MGDLPRVHQVTIQGFSFNPVEMVIAEGDSVFWTNLDGIRHSAKSEGEVAFDTGLIRRNEQSQEVKFVEPRGTIIPYFCEPHPNMTGKIIVQD